ncbi:MAG: hypothetical protein AAGF12_25905 [Myxococcota bacterium]
MNARYLTLAVLASLVSPGLASAQGDEECEDPVVQGPEEATPAFGVRGVTLGAPVRIRYTDGFFTGGVFEGDPAEIFSLRLAETGELVPGRVEVILDTLIFTPDAPYLPMTEYEAVALGTGGSAFNPTFVTGDAFDTGPPDFGNISDVRAFEQDRSCDAPNGGFRIDVTFEAATDDGPDGDIEYLLYLSRGPNVEAPELQRRVRNQTPGGVIVAFNLEPEDAVSPICVAVHAVDGVGNVDDDGQPRCEDPIQGNFFEPLCAVEAPGVAGAAPYGALGLLVVMGVGRILRRRSACRRG